MSPECAPLRPGPVPEACRPRTQTRSRLSVTSALEIPQRGLRSIWTERASRASWYSQRLGHREGHRDASGSSTFQAGRAWTVTGSSGRVPGQRLDGSRDPVGAHGGGSLVPRSRQLRSGAREEAFLGICGTGPATPGIAGESRSEDCSLLPTPANLLAFFPVILTSPLFLPGFEGSSRTATRRDWQSSEGSRSIEAEPPRGGRVDRVCLRVCLRVLPVRVCWWRVRKLSVATVPRVIRAPATGRGPSRAVPCRAPPSGHRFESVLQPETENGTRRGTERGNQQP